MYIEPDYILIFILFILFSPNLLFALPDCCKGSLLSNSSSAHVSYITALSHAVFFIIFHHYLGKSILQDMGLIPQSENTSPKPFIIPMDFVCGILFFLLTPGILFTLPPVNMDFNTNNILFTNKTTIPSVIIHAFIFVIAHHYVIKGMALLGITEP